LRPRTGLDEAEKRKNLVLTRTLNFDPLAVQTVTSRYPNEKFFPGNMFLPLDLWGNMYEYLLGQTIFPFQKFLS
jgi:hypothetical protein